MRTALKYKTDVVAAVTAWWKFLPKDACDCMLFGMDWVVNNAIDARSRAFFARLEYLSSSWFCHMLSRLTNGKGPDFLVPPRFGVRARRTVLGRDASPNRERIARRGLLRLIALYRRGLNQLGDLGDVSTARNPSFLHSQSVPTALGRLPRHTPSNALSVGM